MLTLFVRTGLTLCQYDENTDGTIKLLSVLAAKMISWGLPVSITFFCHFHLIFHFYAVYHRRK